MFGISQAAIAADSNHPSKIETIRFIERVLQDGPIYGFRTAWNRHVSVDSVSVGEDGRFDVGYVIRGGEMSDGSGDILFKAQEVEFGNLNSLHCISGECIEIQTPRGSRMVDELSISTRNDNDEPRFVKAMQYLGSLFPDSEDQLFK